MLQPDELLDPDECYKFLVTETGHNTVGIENFIQMELSTLLHLSRFRQGVSIRYMLDVITGVVTKLVRICLKYSSVHRKYCEDKSYIDVLRLAVENVVYYEVSCCCCCCCCSISVRFRQSSSGIPSSETLPPPLCLPIRTLVVVVVVYLFYSLRSILS